MTSRRKYLIAALIALLATFQRRHHPLAVGIHGGLKRWMPYRAGGARGLQPGAHIGKLREVISIGESGLQLPDLNISAEVTNAHRIAKEKRLIIFD